MLTWSSLRQPAHGAGQVERTGVETVGEDPGHDAGVPGREASGAAGRRRSGRLSRGGPSAAPGGPAGPCAPSPESSRVRAQQRREHVVADVEHQVGGGQLVAHRAEDRAAQAARLEARAEPLGELVELVQQVAGVPVGQQRVGRAERGVQERRHHAQAEAHGQPGEGGQQVVVGQGHLRAGPPRTTAVARRHASDGEHTLGTAAQPGDEGRGREGAEDSRRAGRPPAGRSWRPRPTRRR